MSYKIRLIRTSSSKNTVTETSVLVSLMAIGMWESTEKLILASLVDDVIGIGSGDVWLNPLVLLQLRSESGLNKVISSGGSILLARYIGHKYPNYFWHLEVSPIIP